MVVLCTFYPSVPSVVYVFCIILFKHDFKPTETTLWDEAPLINLQRLESFWLIDPISLKISWKGLDNRGAVVFLWQAERPSETRALRQRFNSPFQCQLSGWQKRKKETARVNEFETHSSQKQAQKGKKIKAFWPQNVFFFFISSPPWLELPRAWLKWDRHLLGSATAEWLLSDFVFVLMHSGAKILTSISQQSSPG